MNIQYKWDVITSQWVLYTKSEYTYDTNGKNTSQGDYVWIADSANWVGIQKNESTYDANGNNILFLWYNWDFASHQWTVTSKDTSYFSGKNTKIPEKNITVYPNPASEYIVFNMSIISQTADLEMFDYEGRKVLEQKFSENEPISVRNLAKGWLKLPAKYIPVGYIYVWV